MANVANEVAGKIGKMNVTFPVNNLANSLSEIPKQIETILNNIQIKNNDNHSDILSGTIVEMTGTDPTKKKCTVHTFSFPPLKQSGGADNDTFATQYIKNFLFSSVVNILMITDVNGKVSLKLSNADNQKEVDVKSLFEKNDGTIASFREHLKNMQNIANESVELKKLEPVALNP